MTIFHIDPLSVSRRGLPPLWGSWRNNDSIRTLVHYDWRHRPVLGGDGSGGGLLRKDGEMIVRAPARNYDGHVLAEIVGLTTDTRGRLMFKVEALEGEPWDDAGMFGWSSTNTRKFYPTALELIETAPTAIEAELVA